MSLAVSPDGETLAMMDDDARLLLRSRTTGERLFEPMSTSEDQVDHALASELIFGPAGKKLLAVRFEMTHYEGDVTREIPFRAQMWDVTTGQPLGTAVTVENCNGCVDFNAAAQTMVASTTPSYDDAADFEAALYGEKVEFRIWDLQTGKPTGAPMVHEGEVLCVKFRSDGKVLASGSLDGTARLWDATSGEPLGAPLDTYAPVGNVFFVEDGKTLLTVSQSGAWRTWDVETGTPRLPPVSLPYEGEVVAAVSADGRRLVTGSDSGSIQEWDIATGSAVGPARMFAETIRSVVFTHQSQSIVAAIGDEVWIWPRAELQETDPAALALWLRSLTGAELDELDALRPLAMNEMDEIRQQLHERGGISKTKVADIEIWRIDALDAAQPEAWPPRMEPPPQAPPRPAYELEGIPAPIVDPSA
jgi:WD40 repeat protein